MGWHIARLVALVWNSSVLAMIAWELITTGNVTIKAHGDETMSGANLIFFTAGLSSSLACIIRGAIREQDA